MDSSKKPDAEVEEQIISRGLEVLIKASFLLAMAVLCYEVFAPFLPLMLWAVILAVTLYPLQQLIARRLRGRQGLAATLVVVVGGVLLIVPTAMLMSSLGESVHHLINAVQTDTLRVPPPPDSIAAWPLVGDKIHGFWALAHADLPALVKSLQPQVGNLAKSALSFVAGIGGGLLQFLAAFIVAGIIMAFGRGGDRSCRAIFVRIAGEARGVEFVKLATATIRAVAQGVIGIALIQSIVIGLCLLLAGVPWAGALSLIVLVMGVAQLPALLVTLPAIAYLWMSGHYGNAEAAIYTVVLVVAGMIDNVLKPLLLGRGVEAPMPIVLIGALGGMATGGILGMFIGATLLALGYQIFMGWVAESPAAAMIKSEAVREDPRA